jgi:hypothetical protein
MYAGEVKSLESALAVRSTLIIAFEAAEGERTHRHATPC